VALRRSATVNGNVRSIVLTQPANTFAAVAARAVDTIQAARLKRWSIASQVQDTRGAPCKAAPFLTLMSKRVYKFIRADYGIGAPLSQ
jgi:hypothetical protein